MRNSKLKSKSSGCLPSKKSRIINNISPSKPEIFQPFCSNLIHAQKLSKGSISPKSQFPKSIKREKERDSSKQKQATCNVLDLFKKIVDNLSTRSSKLEEKNIFVLRKSIEKKKINQEGESSKDTLTTQINSNRAGKHKKIECYPEQKSSKQESLSMLIPKTLKLRKNTSQKQKDTILSYMTLSNQTVGDRINYHLDVLSVLSDYVESWWRSNKDEEEWQQLYFLIYKKYYLERVKVHNFLKKYPIKNPFCLKNAQIQTRQTINFMKSNEGKVRLHKLGFQNMKIKEKLRDYYNFIINKSGGPINLFQVDNFSQVIYKQMWNSFIMIEFCCWMAKQRKMIKMCRILQIGFIISELEGRFIAPLHKVQEAIRTLNLQPYIEQNRELYNKFLAP